MNLTSLSDAELAILAPAFLRIDRNGAVVAAGPALQRLVAKEQVEAFARDIVLGGPAIWQGRAEFEAGDPALRFAGPVFCRKEAILVALQVQPPRSLAGHGALRIDDFATGDPAVPMLMLAEVQAALIDETKTVALDLAEERQRAMALLREVTAAAQATSHELNNLISTVVLNCERMLRHADAAPQTMRLAQVIRDTAMRGAALTRSLMNLARQPEEAERRGLAAEGRQLTRVLIVEDEIHALDALTELLSDLGYAAIGCASAEAALLELENGRFDVLLTDVILPGLSGVDLAIRALDLEPGLRIVLMSGYLPTGAALADDWSFLRKPLDLQRIDAVLRGRA